MYVLHYTFPYKTSNYVYTISHKKVNIARCVNNGISCVIFGVYFTYMSLHVCVLLFSGKVCYRLRNTWYVKINIKRNTDTGTYYC